MSKGEDIVPIPGRGKLLTCATNAGAANITLPEDILTIEHIFHCRQRHWLTLYLWRL